MIMTSFYCSIGGILALGLYGIYRYARTKERAEETGRICVIGAELKESEIKQLFLG